MGHEAKSRGDKGLLLSGNKDSAKQHAKIQGNLGAASCLGLIALFGALKIAKRAVKMAQQVNTLAANLNDPSSTPGNHTVKRRKQESGNLSSDLNTWDP